MKYENPKIPEGINTTNQHPLKIFTILLLGLLSVLLLSAWLLGLGGAYLAKKVPFEQELQLAERYSLTDSTQTELQNYLQALADRVSLAMSIDESMPVTVHYVNEDVHNAFATLGGNVFLYRGLLEKLPNENALSMLIAHETAHILHRDPIVSLGQSAAISMGISLLLGKMDVGLLGNAGLLTQMNFGREMENRADKSGLVSVEKLYGHVNGALSLYEILESIGQQQSMDAPEFLSTHPSSEHRLEDLNHLIQQQGWHQDGAVTPLPSTFQAWLSEKPSDT